MTKESKGKCEAASHKLPKEKTKTRVQELQGRVNHTKKIARKKDRTANVAILVEQGDRMIGGWGAKLNVPSPASSLHGGSHGNLGSFSEDLVQYVIRESQQLDEKEDAESPLKKLPQPNLEGAEPNLQDPQSSNFTEFTGDFIVSSKGPQEDIPSEFDLDHCVVPNVMPDICPPASAFLRPKCAFWECSRPAQGPAQVLCQDYCSGAHAFLGKNEGLPGNNPVLRPGGIDLKDGLLFAALNAKTQGKDVGIPSCDGPATARSPWKDSEVFDLSLHEGEMLREWLFFGRPRRAFERGNRKQRSLPDYSGRGWHESGKKVMKEFGGHKRSYYMDPQPSSDREWHLFEYEVNNSDACALYRLELKLRTAKKSSKRKQ